MTKKSSLIVFGILLLVILGQSLHFNYRLGKQRSFVETEINIMKDSLSIISAREAEIIEKGKTNTNKAANNKKSINDKLKSDEKAIDNRTVTDRELDDLLSRYEN